MEDNSLCTFAKIMPLFLTWIFLTIQHPQLSAVPAWHALARLRLGSIKKWHQSSPHIEDGSTTVFEQCRDS